MSGAAARSIFRAAAVRNGAARMASNTKASRSPFRMSTRTPLTNRLFSCPCELSSMQPFHTATASALMTSMLTLSRRGYGWLPEAFKPHPMSQTMSSPGNNWDQFYQHNAPPAKPLGLFSSNQVLDATTVTTTTISSASGGGLSPEGRVSKPVRKRSRASRRTPTTLLNTDTANFRAMVQQFTGGSLAPFASTGSSTSSYPIATNFSLGIGTGQQYANPNAGMVPRSEYNILQVQQQLQQQQHHQFMFSKNGNTNDDDHHAYLRGLERSAVPLMETSGGVDFRTDGVSSSVPPMIRSSQNLSEDNYML